MIGKINSHIKNIRVDSHEEARCVLQKHKRPHNENDDYFWHIAHFYILFEDIFDY